MTLFVFLLLSACTPEPAAVESVAATEVLPISKRAAMESAVAECKADETCMTSLTADAALLGSCPWYEAVGCSVAVGAAGAACVVTEGEACAEALELVAKIGCCDCLPSGKVQDMCKAI